MKKLTYGEIVYRLDEYYKVKEEDDDDYCYSSTIANFDEDGYNENLGLGLIKEVDSHGGPDEGSDYWKVIHFVDHDIYLKYEGCYSSYESTEWEGDTFAEGATQVYPQTKTIIVYEKA